MMDNWFENDSLWEDLYPFLFPPELIDRASEEVDMVLQLTGCEGGRALDLCCGPGRHSVQLALREFEVTGVDRTAMHLERAREAARAAGVDVEWVLDDARSFSRPASFDLVLSMYTSIGYCSNREENRGFLQTMSASLVRGGKAVIETVGKERLAAIFDPTRMREGPEGSLLIEHSEIVEDWTRVRNRWILLIDGKIREHRFEHTIYSGRELRDMLLDAGFSSVELYGGLDGSAYDTDAGRLIAVATA